MSKIKVGLFSVAILLGLIAYLPYYKGADQFRSSIQLRLESALQRKVEAGAVRFSLWTGPEVTLSDVVIHDDPKYGIEPSAYVSTMSVRPNLWKLLLGRIEIQSLRLDEPSLNLSRSGQGDWNWKAFLPPPGAKPAMDSTSFPEIEVRGGRINFKLANRKSVFYFTDVDGEITLSPDSNGAYSLNFTGAPARSDRPAQGFGKIRSRGRFWLPQTTEPQVDVTIDLERSFIEEILRLMTGRDFGLHAVLTARTRLTGPLSNINLTGRLELGEIPRWAILPGSGSQWAMNYKGGIDYRMQQLAISTDPPEANSHPIGLKFRMENFLGQPRWGLLTNFAAIPMQPLPGLARAVGINLPAAWQMKGTATGVVVLSSKHGLNGLLGLRDASIAMGEDNEAILEQASLLFENGKLTSKDSHFQLARSQSVVVDAVYNFEHPQWAYEWETKELDMPNTEKLRGLCAAPEVPWLSNWKNGTWSGKMSLPFASGEEQQWQGHVNVRNMLVKIPDLSVPIQLNQAAVDFGPGRTRLVTQNALAGTTRWSGEFRSDEKHGVLSVRIPTVSVAGLEAMLEPLLQRKRSFLARTLAFGKAKVPEWVAARRVDGNFIIDSLKTGTEDLEDVRGTVAWQGAKVRFTDLRHRLQQTKSRAQMDLSGPNPSLKIEKP